MKNLNPFVGGPSSAMVPYNQQQLAEAAPALYKAQFLGQEIGFASEADYLKAKMALEKKMSSAGVRVTDDSLGSGDFLGTAGKGIATVGAFLAGRNLKNKVDDLDDALDEQEDARAELQALLSNTTLAPLITPLLRWLAAERTATEAAQAALEDQILAQDLQAGGGVAELVSKFSKGEGFGSNFGSTAALAVGGVGLGLAFSNRNNDRRRRR